MRRMESWAKLSNFWVNDMNPGEATILYLVIGVCAVVIVGLMPWRRVAGWAWAKLGGMLRRKSK